MTESKIDYQAKQSPAEDDGENWKGLFDEWLTHTLGLKLADKSKIELIISHVEYYIKSPAKQSQQPKKEAE